MEFFWLCVTLGLLVLMTVWVTRDIRRWTDVQAERDNLIKEVLILNMIVKMASSLMADEQIEDLQDAIETSEDLKAAGVVFKRE